MGQRYQVLVGGKVVREVPTKDRAEEVKAEYIASGSKRVTTKAAS